MTRQPQQGRALHAFLERMFASELRAWRGQARLARVFWQHGVLASAVLILLYGTAIQQHQPVFEQVLLIASGLYTLYILVSIWRCSEGNTGSWAVLARILIIPWAANVALVLSFRQLELLLLFVSR